MSDYDYDDRPRRRASRRTRERDPEIIREETYIERGKGLPTRDLVYRPREDSVEDIPRDFPPGREYRSHRARSVGRRDYEDYYDYDDRYGGGYRTDRSHRPRHRDDGYYSDEYERPQRRERRKSFVDQAKDIVEDLGLGGVVGAVAGSRSKSRHGARDRDDHRDDRRSRSRHGRYSSSSRSRSRSRSHSKAKWEQAAKAAVIAGAIEAFRSRKEPGPWTGVKGQRVATAALGAAGIDSLLDKNPEKKDKRHIVESAVGGLLANRVANGPRSRSNSRGRSESRSRSRSARGRSKSHDRSRSHGLRDAAGAGAVIAAGKALYDRVRSKSRNRRDRSSSVSSTDSYEVPSRRRNYERRRPKDYDGASSRGRAHSGERGGGYDDASPKASSVAQSVDKNGGSESSTDTDGIETERRKMRGKELITAGLATVATIHAAHGVYASMVASEKRRKLVAEGEMSKEEARKRKSKNMLQDAAAVGIAALGIKSAFSEWKEMNEHRKILHQLEEKRRRRRKARERRERERQQQQQNMALAIPGGAYPANYYGGVYGPPPPGPNRGPPSPANATYGATTYTDANPYGASNVPPPPMGRY